MDARERHAIEYDHDGEPRLYLAYAKRERKGLPWSDTDICVCGVQCGRHWNLDGDWIGCKGARGEQA